MTNRHPRPVLDRTPSHGHQPLNPSSLRQTPPSSLNGDSRDRSTDDDIMHPTVPATATTTTEETALLRRDRDHKLPHPGPPAHGTFLPRPTSPNAGSGDSLSASNTSSQGNLLLAGSRRRIAGGNNGWASWLAKRVRSKKMSQTSALASSAGFKDTPGM